MMNADAMRHFYDYHFAENRKLWDSYVTELTSAQFIQPIDYSMGSVRNQVVHMMSVDDNWFSGLRRVDDPAPFPVSDVDDRAAIRAYWDTVERNMRAYLATLHDDTLFEHPFDGESEKLLLWQVLLHVVNHGTDHRAQLLRILHDFGLKTKSQDYIFYVYDHP